MTPSVKWLVLWSLWACRLVRQSTVTIQVSNGPVRGTISPDGSHAMYQGIPYATVTGRFQSPGPEPKWKNVFEAIHDNVQCKQRKFRSYIAGTTDCLVLNVYTPLNTGPQAKLPVMAFIHGGGFYEGSAASAVLGPNYLVTKGVILVVFNYRLNIQGFLCLGIKEAPGNAAMKDQVAALRWIKNNIKEFGGDPDNVTIFGESAGGASVSFHLYSPMSKGLFHKAITQSGSSLGSWALQYRPVFLASLLAKMMLYNSKDPHELYKYFMTKSDNELILTRVPRKEGNTIMSELLYTPCIENKIEGEEPFFTELPFDILNSGNYTRVPMIIGTCKEEGLLMIGMENATRISQIKFEKSLPKNLHISSEVDRIKIAKELEALYMNGENINIESADKVSRYIGEVNFIYPSIQETELLLRTNEHPIYNYMFLYSGRRNVPRLMLPSHLKKVEGATHADELFYIFSQEIIPALFEYDMIENMSAMWTNFAKYGDPTPDSTSFPVKWHRTNSTNPTSLVIDSVLSTAPLRFNERLKYLREVYSKFRRKI